MLTFLVSQEKDSNMSSQSEKGSRHAYYLPSLSEEGCWHAYWMKGGGRGQSLTLIKGDPCSRCVVVDYAVVMVPVDVLGWLQGLNTQFFFKGTARPC